MNRICNNKLNNNWRSRCCCLVRMLLLALVLMGFTDGIHVVSAQAVSEPHSQQALVSRQAARKIAVVIDDFGNNMQGTREMLALPFPFTAAVMPHLSSTREDAEAAHARGLDVLVHMPMEPVKGKPEWLGPGALTCEMSDQEIRKKVEAAIQDVPHAIGMNNHMGSKVTADARVMRVVLQVLKEHDMFFLDSRTTPHSKAAALGAELGVPVVLNRLFLDEQYTAAHIGRQVSSMGRLSASEPEAVVIGHVGPPGKLTASALAAAWSGMRSEAAFVTLSELLGLNLRLY